MSAAGRSERMQAIALAVATLEERGTCWADWAREREFDLGAVRNVIRRRGPCLRGQAYVIAGQICAEARLLPEPDGKRRAFPPGSKNRRIWPGNLYCLPGWDDPWVYEFLFQVVALFAVKALAGQRLSVLDTSKLSIPDDYNRRVSGAPDLVACVDGRYVAIELKAKDNKTTKPQDAEAERTSNAAGTYVVARTMREVFEALELEVPE